MEPFKPRQDFGLGRVLGRLGGEDGVNVDPAERRDRLFVVTIRRGPSCRP
jgi:hypothetical protein